MILIYTNRARF